MKRIILCLLAPLLLLGSAACAAPQNLSGQLFDFFYRTDRTDYNSEQGVVCPQTRDVGDRIFSYEELFALYMEGPLNDEHLSLPMPRGTQLKKVNRLQALLELHFSKEYLDTSKVDVSVSDACIAKTAFGFDTITHVRILVEDDEGKVQHNAMFDRNDILLFDDSDLSGTTSVSLYFTDSSKRYLLLERRTYSYPENDVVDTEALARYVVEQLIDGPTTDGLIPLLPDGTALVAVSVQNGTCYVDFTRDFYDNRPTEERLEQLALLSVVDALCALDGIDQVQFYVEGSVYDRYTYLSINAPFRQDRTAIGPVRASFNEFDVPLCLPDPENGKLHTICSRIRLTGNESLAEALLRLLLTYPSQNGVDNPFISDAAPLSISISKTTCRLEFAKSPFPTDDPEKKDSAVRSLVATFYEQPGMRIFSVQIVVNGELVTLTGKENLTSLYPETNWYYRSPT